MPNKNNNSQLKKTRIIYLIWLTILFFSVLQYQKNVNLKTTIFSRSNLTALKNNKTQENNSPKVKSAMMSGLANHQADKFFDEYLFKKGVTMANQINYQKDKIYGAILPHHLIPSFIIADIFQRIIRQGTKTIILLTPNHHNAGYQPILTSALPWVTSYGDIQIDRKKMSELLNKDYLGIDDIVLDNEHAVGGLVPFIAYYNQEVKIVPLILKQSLTEKELMDFSQTLNKLIDKDTVVVSSVDFSHYLNSSQAEEHDKKTLKAMQNREYENILEMNSDYLDSPEAIVILLKIMNVRGDYKLKLLYNTNSGRLLNDPYNKTTSYFGIIFTK